MLELQNPTEGLLFFGVLYRSDLHEAKAFEAHLTKLYGKMMSFSPTVNPLSAYYSKEMGEEALLKRIFFVSTTSFPREFLLTTKLLSLEWEKDWSRDGKRMVNVDVGFLSLENFVLATTKNYAHRIFLGQRIFADLTYQHQNGEFKTLPWTYPDFKDREKIDFITWCRSFLLMHSKVESP